MSKKGCMLSNCCIIVIIFFKKIGILPKKGFYLTTVKYYKQVSFADDRNRKGNSLPRSFIQAMSKGQKYLY